MRHTPESQWEANIQGLRIGGAQVGTVEDFTPDRLPLLVGSANIQRAFDCVQACKGMLDPGVEIVRLQGSIAGRNLKVESIAGLIQDFAARLREIDRLLSD